MTGRDWEALGKEVRRRRALLHLRQADLEARGGPGAGTVRNIEQASRESYAQRTFVQLETALLWPDGVVEKILDGTAEPNEIAEVVERGVIHAKSGGAAGVAAGVAAGGGSQTIYPKSIPSRSRVGEPVVHVGNLTPQGRAEQLAHLESGTFDIDREIFKAANHLAGLLVDRHPSTPTTRSALTKLVELMQELAGPATLEVQQMATDELERRRRDDEEKGDEQ